MGCKGSEACVVESASMSRTAEATHYPLLLLPGMDGTGRLFGRFLDEVPDRMSTYVAAYDGLVTYEELLPRIMWLSHGQPGQRQP